MTKIVRLKEIGEKAISRELIQKFGDAIYQKGGVGAVFVKVYFKDGSHIGFKRNEEEDDVESYFEDKKDGK